MEADEEEKLLMDRYHLLMSEISSRANSIRHVIDGKTNLKGVLAKEFCFLQLRMICECLALSCLTAHGQIPEAKTPLFQKESYADKLIRLIESSNPNFYPRPVFLSVVNGKIELKDVVEPYLDKIDLKNLYHICGGVLHRGQMRRYTFTPTEEDLTESFALIKSWTFKILRLVTEHAIYITPRKGIVMSMFTEN